jgi:hypothetical protein
VLLLTPRTVPPPFSASHIWPATLERLSMIAQYTPPHGGSSRCSNAVAGRAGYR